jgi:hypothetical protein
VADILFKYMILTNVCNSLLSLSRVIHALSLPAKKRPKHISYRDAKLTRILQPHLSGNACMAILCCVSASSLHVEETRSTLKFAASAKLIEMKPTVNEVVDHRALLKKLQIELVETKEALRKLQNRSDVDTLKGPDAAKAAATAAPTPTYATIKGSIRGRAKEADQAAFVAYEQQATANSPGAAADMTICSDQGWITGWTLYEIAPA